MCGQRLSAAQNSSQPRFRIVGGSPAPLGSWPWLVNLQLDGGLMCGGVLVESSWVVTAAHCFAGSVLCAVLLSFLGFVCFVSAALTRGPDTCSSRSESYWTAVVGEFDITKADPDEQVLKVNRIIPHPKVSIQGSGRLIGSNVVLVSTPTVSFGKKFRGKSVFNLMFLSQFNPKTFNNDIALVELSSPVILSNHVTPVCLPSGIEPPTGSPCLVAGWGSLFEGKF